MKEQGIIEVGESRPVWESPEGLPGRACSGCCSRCWRNRWSRPWAGRGTSGVTAWTAEPVNKNETVGSRV